VKLEHEPNGAIAQLAEFRLIAPVNRLATNYYIAARRLVQCPQHMHERTLAGAARADDRDHLTSWNGEVHAIQHVEHVPVPADVRLIDVVRLEYGHRHSCRIASIGKSLDA